MQNLFGRQVAERRFERGWSEARLAEEINNHTGVTITDQDVFQWERCKAVPEEHVVEKLARVLIDENDHIAATDKAELRATFIKAANNDREVLRQGGDLSQTTLAGRSTFGGMVLALRNKAKLSKPVLSTVLDASMPPAVTARDVFNIEAGLKEATPPQSRRLAAILGISDSAQKTPAVAAGDMERVAEEIRTDLCDLLRGLKKPVREFEIKESNRNAIFHPFHAPLPFKLYSRAMNVIAGVGKRLEEREALDTPERKAAWAMIANRYEHLAKSYLELKGEGASRAAS